MKKNITWLLFLLFSVSAHAQLTPEQSVIKKIFFDFLKFYKSNEAKFHSFQLYKGTGKENNPPFKMQWKETEKYFTYLRKQVPYVGEAYIKAEMGHFKFADSCFKADPQDEIAAGFDYDRWGGGQESIQYMYKWYTSAKNKYKVTITKNTAVLKIGSELMAGAAEKERSWSAVPFVKEKGKWKMADNIYPVDEGNE